MVNTRWTQEQFDAAQQRINGAGAPSRKAARGEVADADRVLDTPASPQSSIKAPKPPAKALKRPRSDSVRGKVVSGLRPNPEPLRAFKLVLDWPPTANHATKHAQGRHYLTTAHLDYRKLVAIEARQAGVQLIRGRYRMELTFYPPDRRRRDADNLLKVLADALVRAGAIADDCNMRQLVVNWQEWSKDQGARVAVGVCEV